MKRGVFQTVANLISRSRLSSLGLLFLFWVSCSHNEIFFEYHSFGRDGWDRNKAAVYHINIDNTTDLFDVSLEIRNNNDYPFSNIWLFVDFQVPGGEVRTDTVGIDLADAHGKWFGKGISHIHLLDSSGNAGKSFERYFGYRT